MELSEKYKELNIKETPITTFKFKPTGTIIVAMIFGVAFIVGTYYVTNLWIIGAIFILLAGFVQFFAKDYVILTEYDGFFVVHNPKNDKEGKIVQWEEVKEWKTLSSSGQERGMGILLLLTSDEVVYIQIFSLMKISRMFKKHAAEKEASKVQLSKIKNTPLSWFNKKKG